MTTAQSLNPIQSLLADIRLGRKRVLAMAQKAREAKTIDDVRASVVELAMELANNGYPYQEAHLEQTTEIDGVVAEMVDQEGSYIDEELMAIIMHSYDVAAQLADEVRKLMPTITDDLAKKRLGELTGELAKSIELAIMGVSEAAVSDDDDDDEEDEDGEEDGDEEGTEVTE